MSDNKMTPAPKELSYSGKKIKAYGATYGAGINPEAVPELLNALEELSGFCERHFTTAKAGWISRRAAIKAIDKAKL